MATTSNSVYPDSKSHFQILDGLRGVAAIMVIFFHLLETFSESDHTKQIINHGYLAVDFFFLLSGFVIGYAYDDRWGSMSLSDFFKRRLIRLQPMIIAGMIIGAIAVFFQECEIFPGISQVPIGKLLLITLIGCTLLPVPASLDIRGWAELHPLNGPAWSLFYEYIGNVLYALVIRRLSNLVLGILVVLAAAALIHLAVTSPNGDIIGGWSLDPAQIRIGLTRLLYPFLAGLLLSRIVKPGRISNAFLWCSLLLILMLSIPRIGGKTDLWMNGVYDSLVIIFVFPVIVYMGASGTVKSAIMTKTIKFLGDISYPLYIIHYPIMYIYMAWVVNNKAFLLTFSPEAVRSLILVSLAVIAGSIGIAYACVKLYDEPVRKWLMRKLLI